MLGATEEILCGPPHKTSKISLVEAIEDMQAYVLGHPRARIAHRHEGAVRYKRDLGPNFAKLRCVTNCVIQQYSQQTLQQKFIAFDIHSLSRKMPVQQNSTGFRQILYTPAPVDD